MNKSAIKKFAVWARTKLMADIRTRLGFVGITEDEVKAPLPFSTKEIQYFQAAGTEPVSVKGKNILARKDLAEKLQKDAKRSGYQTAYESLVETTASAWFNRLVAIRFMEVNGYLSDGIRMLSSEEAGKNEPDVVTMAFDSDLEFTDAEREKIFQCKLNSETDKAFRILFFKRCHQLQKILPGLFEKEGDTTEFLMRLSVVDTDGVIYHLVHDIAEEDFRIAEGGQVEIIGWMYQYYNSELKDDTFAKLKKNIKVTKERIPSATQLFTPDWIVRYMVENSLGRLWIEHLRAKVSDTDEKATAERFGWKYYLPEAKQEEAVVKQLTELRKPRADLKPEDIRCIDPCMGSGHILSYLFDVLMQIYLEEGYDARDAVEQIVTKNLYGLDIDDRAGQLAYFTVMMKARSYDRGFFRRGLQPHVQAIQESNGLQTWKKAAGDSMLVGQLTLDDQYIQMADELIETFHDAKEYGSLLTVKANNYDGLLDCIERMKQEGGNLIFSAWMEEVEQRIEPIIAQAKMLLQKYDVVVTNPPYMGSSNMAATLSEFVKKNYADYKSDLFSACMIKFIQLMKSNGYLGFLSPYVWMFISSYEKLRHQFIDSKTIETLIQFEYSAFEEATVPICTFVLRNQHLNKKGCYLRLVDYRGGMEVQRQKALEAIVTHDKNMYYEADTKNFAKIPGAPIAYWVSEKIYATFAKAKICDVADAKSGMTTTDNERFLRLWFEVSYRKIGFGYYDIKDTEDKKYKWFPFSKGGDFRKWYGNLEYVVNWYNNGKEIRKAAEGASGGRLVNIDIALQECLVWTKISSSAISFRYKNQGIFFSDAAPGVFNNRSSNNYLLGLLNSPYTQDTLYIINPTLNYVPGAIANIPYIDNNSKDLEYIVEQNISTSKRDWDSFETSWDFKRHPLV